MRAGLHPAALQLLAERRIAVLGSDGNNDTAPSATQGVDFPVHVLAVNAMSLHLLDWLRFDDLVAVCAELDRWSFLCGIAPLRLGTGTGSPVNPIVILRAPCPERDRHDQPYRSLPSAFSGTPSA